MDSLDRLNEIYSLAAPPLRPATPPSLEAIEGWLKQHRDAQDKHYRRHVLDAAVESVEEIRRMR